MRGGRRGRDLASTAPAGFSHWALRGCLPGAPRAPAGGSAGWCLQVPVLSHLPERAVPAVGALQGFPMALHTPQAWSPQLPCSWAGLQGQGGRSALPPLTTAGWKDTVA